MIDRGHNWQLPDIARFSHWLDLLLTERNEETIPCPLLATSNENA
jgi:hypothetical protein